MSRKALFVCLGLLGVAACATDALAEIVPNSLQGRFVEIDSTGPGQDGVFHVGEAGAVSLGTDLARSTLGASIFSASGTGGHGSTGALISGVANTGGSTWTRSENTAGAIIDLGSTKDLQSLYTHQRNDGCCQNRLRNFTISLLADNGGSPGAVVFSDSVGGTAVPTNSSTEFVLAAGNTIRPGGDGVIGTETVGNNARFIRVQNDGGSSRSLHTSEIEGFAPSVTPNNNSAPSTNDIAGTSFHSQQGSGGHGSVNSVFDGNLETGAAVWTKDGIDVYYTLDLGSTVNVETVRTWQRADGCCQDRLSNFTVSLLTDDGSGNPGAVMASESFPGTAATNSFAEFTFADDFTIGADDILEIEIDLDAMTADSLIVGAGGTGDLTIDPGATLNLIISGNKLPQVFDVLDFGSVNGMFTNINLIGDNTQAVDLSNLLVNGQVALTPEPTSIAIWTLLSLVLGAYVLRRKW